MSLSSIAMPGSVRTVGTDGKPVSVDNLFGSIAEKEMYSRILGGAGYMNGASSGVFKVKGVHVKIFDMSDIDQLHEYEKLQKDLLERTSRLEVVVESRKDLVHRKDGTSYWMKYVEYIEFELHSDDSSKNEQEEK